MFPIYVGIQDENIRFSKIYLKVILSIAIITFPMMIGVLSLAEPFITVFLGPNWQPTILLIYFLAPVGLIQSIETTVGSIYQAKGRTDWMFRWGIVAGIVVIFAFFVGIRWGIVGVAAAYTLASFILFYPNFSIPFGLINLEFIQLLRVLVMPLTNSILMFVVLFVFQMIIRTRFSDALVLFLSIFLGVFTYAVASWITIREHLVELWSTISFKTLN